MAIFKKKILTEDPVTEKDLPEIKHLNTRTSGGQVYGFINEATPTYEQYQDYYFNNSDEKWSGRKAKYLFLLISTLRLYYFNKYKIDNLPKGIDKFKLLNFIFTNGSVVVFKMGGEYYTLPFTTDKYDLYGEPKVITPFTPFNRNVKLKQMVVNKECVILRDSIDGVSTNIKTFGILYKMWQLLEDTANQYNEIANDAILSRLKIAVGDDVDDETIKNIEQAFMSGKFVIKFDFESIDLNQFLAGKGTNPQGQAMTSMSRQKDLTETFTFLINQIKLHMLEKTDPNPQKKERKNVQETIKEDTFIDKADISKMEILEQGILKINELFNENITIERNEEQVETIDPEQGDDENVN